MADCYKLTVSFRKGDIRRKETFVITKVSGDCVYAIPIRRGVQDFLFTYLKNIFLNANVKNSVQESKECLNISFLFEKGSYQETNEVSFEYKEKEDYKKWAESVVNKIISRYLEISRTYNSRLKNK